MARWDGWVKEWLGEQRAQTRATEATEAIRQGEVGRTSDRGPADRRAGGRSAAATRCPNLVYQDPDL